MNLPKNARVVAKYLIKVESNYKKRYVGGVEIYVDNTYNVLENTQSVGKIIKEPVSANMRHKNISKGDTVLLHHFATQNNKLIKLEGDKDGLYYFIDYSKIYMSIKSDGSYLSVGPYCILSKEDDKEINTESGIYTGKTNSFEEGEGKVVASCDEFEELGGKEGDIVLFDKGIDYDIELPSGDIVYKVRVNSIYAIKNV